jgi:hypothetical protein
MPNIQQIRTRQPPLSARHLENAPNAGTQNGTTNAAFKPHGNPSLPGNGSTAHGARAQRTSAPFAQTHAAKQTQNLRVKHQTNTHWNTALHARLQTRPDFRCKTNDAVFLTFGTLKAQHLRKTCGQLGHNTGASSEPKQQRNL